MSRYLAVCLSAAVAAAAAPAQSPAGSADAPPAPGPWANKLFLSNLDRTASQPAPQAVVQDFGTVPHGTVLVHTFTVTNIYDVPIQVLDVRRSCGCLEVVPPQKVLQPNESAAFPVTLNTGKFTGPNTQTVYVTFGPNYISTAVLKIAANSRTDVELSPGQVNFGTVPVGGKPAQTVTLEYHGRQRDWKVTGVVVPAGPVEVEVKEADFGLLGTRFRITVRLKPNAPPGPLHEVVSLKTNDPTAPVVSVQVVGTVQAPVMLSANVVRFEKVKVGEIAVQKVMARAPAGPFQIRPLADSGDGLSVETFPAPAPVQVLTVRFSPTKPGVLRKTVELKTDLDGGKATFVVEAEAVP